jgi:GT2 family glycosyltransferase
MMSAGTERRDDTERLRYRHAIDRSGAPVCSICVANYNGEALLDDCLQSILTQDGEVDCEIIVHDDASTDGSVALLQARYPQVELLMSADNVGFCASNNRMVACARGEFVLLLNNDATLQPDALQSLIAAARAAEGPQIMTVPQYDWISGQLVDRGCLLDLSYNPVPSVDANRNVVAYAIGACLWLPRSCWNVLGGFPEWMGSIAEDMYLCCVARLRGISVRSLDRSGYRHRQGASFGGNRTDRGRLTSTVRRRFLSERNKTAVLIICTPGWLVLPLLLVHVSLLVLEGIILTCVKLDSDIWTKIYGAALASLVADRRLVLDERRKVQKARIISLRRYFSTFTFFPQKLRLLLRGGIPRIGR